MADKIDDRLARVKSLARIATLNKGPEKVIRELLEELPSVAEAQRASLIEQAKECLTDEAEATLDNGTTPRGLREWRKFTSEEIATLLHSCEDVVGAA